MKPSRVPLEKAVYVLGVEGAKIEKLVHALGIQGSWFAGDVIEQAATRLRNSIPKPVVRFTPPTVDEVPDDDWCMARLIDEDGDAHEFWEQLHGDHARQGWGNYYDAWISRTALGLEGGE